MKRILLAIGLVGVGLMTAACNLLNPSYSISYSVGGTAQRASMTYAGRENSTLQTDDLVLPWGYTFEGKKGDFMYISAQNGTSSGCVRVEIKVNGDTFRSDQSCGAFVIATVSGSAGDK